MTTSRPVRSPGRTGALALLLALVLAVAGAVPGLAHDTLTDSSPAEGSSGPAPTEVALTFSGALGTVGSAVQVTGPEGPVSQGEPQVGGSTVTQALVADLPAGEYTVQWRVTSSDGHPVSGEYTFTVQEGAGGGTGEAPATTEAPAPDAEEPTADQGRATGEAAAVTGDTPATEEDEDGDGSEQDDDSGALPWWGWALVVAAVIGLGALVGRVVRSSR